MTPRGSCRHCAAISPPPRRSSSTRRRTSPPSTWRWSSRPSTTRPPGTSSGWWSSWEMLADLSFSDLLLYVPLPDQTGSRRRFLVVNQIRPNTGQTLFEEDVVGRTVDEHAAPARGRAPRSTRRDRRGRGGLGVAGRAGEGHRGPGACTVDRVVAVMARESPLALASPARRPGAHLPRDLRPSGRDGGGGEFPFADEEVLSAGGPRVGDGVMLVDATGRVTFASPNAVSALRRLGRVGGDARASSPPTSAQRGDGVLQIVPARAALRSRTSSSERRRVRVAVASPC